MATEAIHKIVEELGSKLEEANQLITNNKNRYEPDELEIQDRIAPIIEIKKVISKRNLMLNLEKRCQSIPTDIDSFMLSFGILREKGLPSPMVIHDKLMNQEVYNDKVNKLSTSQASTSRVKSSPTGRVLYDGLENLFYIEDEVKHLFTSKPSFAKYTEADEVYRKMIRITLPKS